MSDRWPRIQMVMLRANELELRSKQAARNNDLERVTAINDELEVLYESMLAIRREQIMEQLEPPSKPKRRWWKFWVNPVSPEQSEDG